MPMRTRPSRGCAPTSKAARPATRSTRACWHSPAARSPGSPMRATVKEKREVAKGTLLVVFDLLGQEVDFRPGQYFWVTLVDPPYDDEKGPRRHITVVTSPNERGVLGLCTRLRDSAFKRSLSDLPVGAPVEVEEPKGAFVLPEGTDRPYVFVAGGIGITVFRTMTDDPAWEGETRRIDADLLRDHLDEELGSFTYLVAGPPAMVEAIEETLRGAGVADEHIQPERFSGY